MRNGTTENPSGVISVSPMINAPRGSMSPHSLLLRIPKTMSPAEGGQQDPDDVQPRRLSDRGIRRIRRRTSRMTATIAVSAAKT